MGNVRSGKMMLRSPTGSIYWTQKTKFFVSSKSFVIDLPDWWHDTLGFKTVSARTLDGVDVAFHEAMMEYEERQTSKRKVILFTFKASAAIWSYNNDGSIKKALFREKEVTFSDGTALDFWWLVGYELTSKVREKKTYTNLNGDSIMNPDKVMEWSEKRELFFLALQQRLETLIVQAHTFFNLEMEQITKMIETHENLESLPYLTNEIKEPSS